MMQAMQNRLNAGANTNATAASGGIGAGFGNNTNLAGGGTTAGVASNGRGGASSGSGTTGLVRKNSI